METENKLKNEIEKFTTEIINEARRVLERPVKELGLSTRTTNILLRARCRTFRDVLTIPAEDILRIRGCGITTLYEIAKHLRESGFPNGQLEHLIKGIERYGTKNTVLRKLRRGKSNGQEGH